MLMFLDETFRTRKTKTGDLPFGAMCGVAIRETDLTRVANDVFKLKQKHLGDVYAREKEIKGKELLKNYAFKMRDMHGASSNLSLVNDLTHYIRRRRIPVFGTVCFQDHLHQFACQDVTSLDKTFRLMPHEYPGKKKESAGLARRPAVRTRKPHTRRSWGA